MPENHLACLLNGGPTTQPGQDAVVTYLAADPGVRLLDGHRPPDCFHGKSVDRCVTHGFIGEKGFDLPLQGSVTALPLGSAIGVRSQPTSAGQSSDANGEQSIAHAAVCRIRLVP
jgi:hypothetical protein